MNRVISIRIVVPEGVSVRIGDGAPFDDEDEPLPPPWVPPGEPVMAVSTPPGGRDGSAIGSCPVHHLPWRAVPAGISRTTGRGYSAFTACPERGCQERPR